MPYQPDAHSTLEQGGALATPGTSASRAPQTLVLMGVPLHNVTFQEAVAWTLDHIRNGVPGYIATVNLDFALHAWQDPEMHRALLEADLVIADGYPLVWSSGLFGPPLKERVTGSDLTPMLAGAFQDAGLSLFALGGAPGVAEEAMRRLRERFPRLAVAGCYSPPQNGVLGMNHDEILDKLDRTGPDLLLVAFGAPKQEKWIRMHYQQWRVPLAMGVGGTLDFIAGTQTRAPRWIQRIGLEWLWRLGTGPRRYFARYVKDFFFLAGALLRLGALRFLTRNVEAPSTGGMLPPLEGLDAIAVPFPPIHGSEAAAVIRDAWMESTRDASLVLDLRGRAWLSSLELGVIVDWAKSCRKHERRLFLARVPSRITRFLAACRLDRYLSIVASDEDLVRQLHRLQDESSLGKFAEEKRLRVVLPEELRADNAEEFKRRFQESWTPDVREVLIDAHDMRFVDCSGLKCLNAVKTLVEEDGTRTVRFLGFTASALRVIRKMGMNALLTEAPDAIPGPQASRQPRKAA